MIAAVDKIDVSVFKVPTDGPESDGTIEWDSTTVVLVQVRAGAKAGLGFTYASKAAARLVQDTLAPLVLGSDAMSVSGIWQNMVSAVRNIGRPGIASMAISAVDIALWDLKARLLHLPLITLLGQVRTGIAAYGSGGFTSYDISRLKKQLAGWARSGLRAVKMKVGRHPDQDPRRVRAARAAIGQEIDLFVDANGAYSPKQALAQAERFADEGVTWFEEPVSSDDLEGLKLLRDCVPPGMRITAGEYGFDSFYFRRMLQAKAVDTLQADATRCGGVTGFLKAGTLCEAFQIPLSAHTAPSIHQHLCCALTPAINVEYFYDHFRIEHLFFDGAAKPLAGELRPDPSQPGLGLVIRRSDINQYEH
jgi:L-alanine-DL-glutamate epimerase-like enolase superfamily enzyme